MIVQRDFLLPPFDVAFLDASGWQWETLSIGTANWLLIHQFAVPPGYNHALVTVAMRIEAGYPDAQIDMAYFWPLLTRTDQKQIGAADSKEDIAGKSYQRWSRHRTVANPWRAGIDDVSTHLALVGHWLEREFAK
jgi:hypothetical protein